jgi:hypothetical protein
VKKTTLLELSLPVLVVLVTNDLWNRVKAYPGPKTNEREVVSVWPHEEPRAIGREDIHRPSFEIDWPPLARATGTEMIICPGGRGYIPLDRTRKRNTITEWLNSLGMAGLIVKHRLGFLSLSGNVAGRAAGAILCGRARH